MSSSGWWSVVVDAHNPASLGRFWADVLGYQIVYEASDEVVVAKDEHTHPGLLFGLGSDQKRTKNRLHIDLRPDDQEAEVERILRLGGRRVDIGQSGQEPWVVLADPEGNEFCVLQPTSSQG
jgi:predicted enzyme related to lactoylglutathione lyase